MKRAAKLYIGSLVLAVFVSGCATRSPHEEANDPLEPVNRVVYEFNDTLDRWVLRPVAEGYVDIVPGTARTGVRNFFNNLYQPITIINDVLQGKPHETASDTLRFGFNTTFGVLGLIDVASGWGLPYREEDFGQTFAVWGFGEGWYLVLPVLGPSNVRDGIGLIPEWQLEPINRVDDDYVRYGLHGLRAISKRADLLSASKVLDTAALDPYLQVREAYRQQRWSEIHDGDPPEPDFLDDELFED